MSGIEVEGGLVEEERREEVKEGNICRMKSWRWETSDSKIQRERPGK